MVVRDDLAWDTIEGKMLSNGVDMPSTFEPIELCLITKLDIFNMRQNINIACDDWWITWEDILSQGKMSYCMSGYAMAMNPPLL